MHKSEQDNLYSILKQVKKYEDDKHTFSNTFTDMLKNEIDATEELEVYNNLSKLISRYKDDHESLQMIEEIVEALTNGAKLSEILLIAKDEIEEPTPVNVMNTDEFNNIKH